MHKRDVSLHCEEYISGSLMIYFANVQAHMSTHAHLQFTYHMATEKNGHSVEYVYYVASSLERSMCHMLLGQCFFCTFAFAAELSESSFGNKGIFGQNRHSTTLKPVIPGHRYPNRYMCFTYFLSQLFFLLHFCFFLFVPLDGM